MIVLTVFMAALGTVLYIVLGIAVMTSAGLFYDGDTLSERLTVAFWPVVVMFGIVIGVGRLLGTVASYGLDL